MKQKLGKSLVDAGGSLMGSDVSGSNPHSACSTLIFVPAIMMYGLLIVFTFVGKLAWDQKLCKCFYRKLSNHNGISHLSLATVDSTV